MKQDERKALIGKYILLILGSVLILVPLLATLFSSFKPTKDIVPKSFIPLSTRCNLQNP